MHALEALRRNRIGAHDYEVGEAHRELLDERAEAEGHARQRADQLGP